CDTASGRGRWLPEDDTLEEDDPGELELANSRSSPLLPPTFACPGSPKLIPLGVKYELGGGHAKEPLPARLLVLLGLPRLEAADAADEIDRATPTELMLLSNPSNKSLASGA